jgi:hypothetical protein
VSARQELMDVGKQWKEAKNIERGWATAAYLVIQRAALEGIPETQIARLAQVDRMTVRKALGKR